MTGNIINFPSSQEYDERPKLIIQHVAIGDCHMDLKHGFYVDDFDYLLDAMHLAINRLYNGEYTKPLGEASNVQAIWKPTVEFSFSDDWQSTIVVKGVHSKDDALNLMRAIDAIRTDLTESWT